MILARQLQYVLALFKSFIPAGCYPALPQRHSANTKATSQKHLDHFLMNEISAEMAKPYVTVAHSVHPIIELWRPIAE